MLQRDHLTITSELTGLYQVQAWFKQFCLKHDTHLPWLKDQFSRLNLALTEGFTNAVRHAHHQLPPETMIQIDVELSEQGIEIRIWDQGQPFDPDTLEEPKPGTLQEGGYGWFLLRRLADRVVYERYQDRCNCLLIVKHHFQQV